MSFGTSFGSVQFLVSESSPAGKALDEFDGFHQIHPLATPLCNELERNHCKNVKIRVEKVDNSSRLYASKEHQSAARELSPIVSLTLNELLVTEVLQELKPWQKYTLSYFVALAIWQYYDTKWMPVPCFYPKLMALGILLIEIFSSKRYSEQDQLNPNEEVILQNYIDYCDLTIINRCFDSSIFKKATDTQGRRDIIWEKIVLPLEQLYRNEVCIEDFQTDLYEAQFASQDFPLLGSNSPVYFPQSSTEILPSLARGLSAGITQDRVNAWQCTQFRDVNHIFVQLARQRSWERIKIAVIDTGFSLDAAHFKMFGRDEAKRVHFKDFVDVQNTSPIDTDHHDEAGGPGHGTLVVTLLLKLLPKAIIYVARVVETRAAFQSEDSPRRIAEAIRWVSLHESTQVHVVSLSFGFENNSLELGHEVPERCDKIAEAIIECRRERKYQLLFFAAAGNDGMDSHEMFPASMHRHVISVRGTELSGGFDDQYNPAVLPGRPQDLPLYGILANEVPCDGGIRMSGTSVATPLLAATAVLFLQYSSWITQKHSVPPEFASRMYEMRSMTKLFREIGRTKGEQIQRNARYALVGVQPRFFFEDASLDNVDTWSEKVWNAIDYWP
ncbi:subtilisin-like protein [Thozetella sp. PMI_491]|nr:subtilisin-like protein [Thozetella sp. PMI_491]